MKRDPINSILIYILFVVMLACLAWGLQAQTGVGHVVSEDGCTCTCDDPTPTPPWHVPTTVPSIALSVQCNPTGGYLVSWSGAQPESVIPLTVYDLNGTISFGYGAGSTGSVTIINNGIPWLDDVGLDYIEAFDLVTVETTVLAAGGIYCE